MIFKTIQPTESNGLTEAKTVSFIKARKIAEEELNATLAKQEVILKADTDALRELEAKVASGIPYEQAFAQSMNTASASAKEHAIVTKGAAGSTDVFVAKQKAAQTELKATATVAKGAGIAMKALSVVGNMLVFTAITTGISLLTKAIDNYIHRTEIMLEKAEEASSNIQDTNAQFESHKKIVDECVSTYEKLSKGVDTLSNKNISLSDDDYEEYLRVTNELAEAFPQLRVTVDENGNSIIQFSDKTKTATENLKNFLEQEKQTANYKIAQSLPDLFGGVVAKKDELGKAKNALNELNQEMESFNRLSSGVTKGKNIFSGTGDYSNIYNTLVVALDKYRNSLIETRKVMDASLNPELLINAQQNTNGEYKIEFDTSGIEDIDKLSEYIADAFKDIDETVTDSLGDARTAFNDAQAQFDTAWVDFRANLINAMQSKASYQGLDTASKQLAEALVGNLPSEIAAQMDDDDPYKWISDNIISQLRNIEDPSIKEEFQSKIQELLSFEEGDLNIVSFAEELQRWLDANGIYIDLTPIIKDEQEAKTVLQKSINNIAGTNGATFGDKNIYDRNKLEEYTKNFTEAERQHWLTVTNGIIGADNAIKAYEESLANANVNETDILSFSDAWNSEDFEDARKELLSLAEAGQLTPETLQSTEEYKTLLEQTGLSAEEAAKKINSMTDASTQLQSMSEQISKMSDMLADKKNGTTASADDLAGFDVEVRGLDSWQEFEKVMMDSKSSMEDCQSAANALATEWVNSNNFLANLTDETKQAYITQLDKMGVDNAEAVVEAKLAEIHREEALALQYATAAESYNASEKGRNNQITTDFLNITGSEIDALIQAGGEYINTANDIAAYKVQKAMANGITLDTSADIQNLADLAGASTKLGQLLEKLNQIKRGFTYGASMGAEAAQMASIQKQIEDLIGGGSNKAVVDVPVDVKSTGSNKYKNTTGSPKQEKSKTTVDFIQKKLNTINHQLDTLQEKYDGIFSPKKKKDNLDKQIEKLERLEKVSTKAAKKYQAQADSIKFYDDTKKDSAFKKKIRNGDFDITEYDSEFASKIQAYEDYISKVRENNSTALSAEQQQREKRIEQYQLNVDDAEAKIAKSQAVAENGKANYKSQNSHLEYQKKQIKESYYYQIKMAELEGEMIKADQLRAERKKALNDVTKQEFDYIKETFDYQIGHIDDRIDDLTNAISAVENKGFIADASYYNAQASVHEEILGKLESEKKKLREQLNEIDKQTPAWYSAVQSIQDVDNQIQETKNTIESLKDSINGVADTLSGNILDSFHDLNEEADTLITLLGDNLSDDKLGNLTKEGITALGLYNQQMNVSKASAENIQNEIRSIQDAINNGTYTKFIDANGMERQFESIYQAKDRIKELQSTYRSEIQSTYQYESKIVDLMKQKYQSELNYVKELIEQKTSLLDAEKSLHDYAQSIKQESENINSLRKQIQALQGDSSKEITSRIQKLQKQLKDSEQSLQDKQYDRYVSDQKEMLSNLSKEYSELIESTSKDRDTLLKEGNQLIASNGAQIQQTINDTASQYGVQLSTDMSSATSQITGGLSAIKELLQSIADYEKDRVVSTTGDGAGGGNIEDYTPAGQIKSVLENGSNKNPTSSLAKAVSEAFGVGLNRHEMAQISGLLGLGYKFEDFLDNSPKKTEAKNAVLEALLKEGYLKKSGGSYIRGYAKGGVISSVADAIRLNGDKVLVSANPGERILTAEQNENFEKFTKALPSLVNLTDVIKPNVNVPTAIDRNIGGVTYGGNNQINIELPNVTNYEDFMRKFQNDPKAEQLVQHMTASALNGSRLGKNTIRF